MPRSFFETYTADITAEEIQRLFTRDAREAYQLFARGVDFGAFKSLPWHRRILAQARLLFLAFTLKLSPARRALYGAALVMGLVGALNLFRGFRVIYLPAGPFLRVGLLVPHWDAATFWLIVAFLLLNLLMLLEVADRLSLKRDLDVAREIQTAMLPRGPYVAPGLEAYGYTRPANTVGGDFYDLLPLADGRLIVALGDVAGKGSPAALLMALLLAMLRTLVDEGLQPADLIARLNLQIVRHAPPSRFITLFFATYHAPTGVLTYVNAGQTPPLVRRVDGRYERLEGGGIALGMFEGSQYAAHETRLRPGDLLVLYSDGITEAENPRGQPFEETGLQGAIEVFAQHSAPELAAAVVKAVEKHTQDHRLADDLTLVLLRARPLAS